MRKNLPFWLFVLVAAAALAASGMLFVDYVRPSPAFCDGEGPCGAVKRTVFAYPFGVPMPVFGLSGIFAVVLSAMVSGARARVVQMLLACFGAVVAIGLLVVQASMKTICPYCAVVDTSMVVLAALSIARLVKKWDPPRSWRPLALSASTALVAVAAPIAIGMTKKPLPPEVPDVIAKEVEKTPRGKVTIVDFVDFECPYCRRTHAAITPLLEEHRAQVRVARKHVPLRIHPHALDAARTACCAEALGKGDEVADALFSVDAHELTPEGCEKLVGEHGLDVEKFRACLRDPSTEARIRSDSEDFRASHSHGLPTLWIGGANTMAKLEGEQGRESLQAALETALHDL